MNLARIKAVISKDWSEFKESKYLFYSVIFMPIFLSVIFPIAFLAPMNKDNVQEFLEAPFIPPEAQSDYSLIIEYITNTMLPMFMLIPLMVSTILGAHSFVGEKVSRTLEPLLATPVSDNELFTGKILSILIPSLIATLVGFCLFAIVTNFLSVNSLGVNYIPSATWLLALVLLMPLLSFIGITVTVLISSRVNDLRSAQQLSGLVSLPIMGLLILNISGALMIGVTSVLIITVVLGLIFYALFKTATKLFNRERILTSWK